MPNRIIIKRDAGDKTKGFLLQKLRATSLLLDKIKTEPNSNILVAVEYKGDIFLKDEMRDYTEETKNYTSRNFSFFSDQVQNTIAYFLEIWIESKFDPHIYFGFYSTTKIAKEKRTPELRKNGIKDIPDKPILDLIIQKKWNYPNFFSIVKKRIFSEYKSQYKVGIDKIITDGKLQDFLSRIVWNFKEMNEKELELFVLNQIKKNTFYKQYDLKGKEASILSNFLFELEKRQDTSHITQKFINRDKIELVFLREKTQIDFSTKEQVAETQKTLDKIFRILIHLYGEKYFTSAGNNFENI